MKGGLGLLFLCMKKDDLKAYLDQKYREFNTLDFIETDPIQLPHRFERKEDIEIVAFLVSTIAWGNRKSIIRSGEKLIDIMGNEPYEFTINYQGERDFDFKHRTFNSTDLDFFFRSLKNIYLNNGLEAAFGKHDSIEGVKGRIVHFRELFLSTEHEQRSEKHISNPLKNSAAKRLNMFLRWMVRKDNQGVDFGIWNSIDPSELYLPLDVHTSTYARKLNLLKRKQDDWNALDELMDNLRKFDQNDPVKYDFALFGLGAFEQIL